jgi:Na+/H+ antiporter NhaD/arsenite permease-like protein
VAISLLVWVGGTIGGVIDNIPFTQTMIPVVARLASSDMGLPLTPLVWALVFGCCLGGTSPAASHWGFLLLNDTTNDTQAMLR